MGREDVKITADTNVLLRAVVQDDEEQAAAVRALLLRATVVAVPVLVFCELAWVLKSTYACSAHDIAAVIEAIKESNMVATDLLAVEAGLAALRAGGDFADGVIAHQGAALGGTTFASFDRRAVARVRAVGADAADPSELIA